MFHKTYPQITQITQKAESTTSAKAFGNPLISVFSAALAPTSAVNVFALGN
jgi:hypothetical protein